MSGQGAPGRYNRSFGGLIGSIIVIVVLVVAFVLFRKLVSTPVEFQQPPVDYLDQVTQLQAAGFDPVYPSALPAGWTATDVQFTRGEPPTFGLSLRTGDQTFVGVEESGQTVSQLVDTYVDDDASTAPDLSTPGGLAETWKGWSDAGGDHAYTATLDGSSVIVYGPASADDLAGVVRSLTTDARPLATAFPSGASSSGASSASPSSSPS